MARDSKADQMYSVLREEILSGQLRPGESLSVLRVADRFGASRTPVRDAFMRLESDGLVSLIDRQGARVSPISISGVRDLFEMRTMLEGSATRQVAQAAAHDDKVRGVFRDLINEFQAVAAQEPSPQRRERFYELAEAYDQAVIVHARNQHLSRMVADLRPHSARLRIIAHSRPDRLEVSLQEHLAMCEAIVASDADAATAACVEHLNQTQKTILDAVLNPDAAAVPVDIVSA
jgi:DNA-binding GntR family transcriptional regulator